jgi:hypothetical protein
MLEREKTDERVHHMIHLASFAGQELGEAYSISLTNPRLATSYQAMRKTRGMKEFTAHRSN